MDFNKLMEPGKIGTLELKNRFVVPPMDTSLGTLEGAVTDDLIEYYRQRAAGGFGLIVIEFTAVDPRGRAIGDQIGLWDDAQIPKFKEMIDAIHAEGAKVIVQLHHGGRQSLPYFTFGQPLEAPSKIPCPLMGNVSGSIVSVPEAMSEERVWKVIDEFGDAAVRAKKAGADGIEVHGAHGYLVAQFMSPHANKRMDDFGGDFAGRMKFPQEIFRNIRSKVGADYPMMFRFGYDEKVHGGRTIEESIAVARMAEAESVDALDISIMTYASVQYMSASPEMPAGFNQFPTKMIKDSVKIPVIAVGRFNPYIAETALENGCADFIAFGRASLADPNFANKVMEGRLNEISPCISCTQACLSRIFRGERVSCLVNPLTGHELIYDMTPVENPKNVVVVGSGPAGLEAALIAAQKGHKVTVFEKEDIFGGQFRLAAVPPTKQDIATALKYWHNMCKKYGVVFQFGVEATADMVKELQPDAVILATGGNQAKPPIPGIDGEQVVFATDILDGNAVAGRNVLVLGGGMTGVETADFMGEHNRKVTILEMRDDIALDEATTPRAFLLPRLQERGIQKIVKAKVKEITADGVIYTDLDGENETKIGGFDQIVLALGVRSNNPLEESLKDTVNQVFVVGDASKPGPADKATEEALAAVFAIK